MDEYSKIMAGMEEVYRAEGKWLDENAPRCHNRPMVLEASDKDDGFPDEEWWECSVCGHTKDIPCRRQPLPEPPNDDLGGT
jgi:hypothetical protein